MITKYVKIITKLINIKTVYENYKEMFIPFNVIYL